MATLDAKPEGLIESDRTLVVGEDVQLDTAQAARMSAELRIGFNRTVPIPRPWNSS